MRRIFEIIAGISALVALIFLALWLFQVVFPFADAADAYQTLTGRTYAEYYGVEYILNIIFGSIYFILMIVFFIVAGIVAIIGKIVGE